MKNNVILIAGLLLSMSACGPIDDMKEMKNTTAEMKNTTKELAEISKGMAKSTGRIDGYSANTYRDMRLDTSISNGFKALNEMEAASSIEQKVIAAAYYMASFEFQLWKNTDLDNEHLREQMYALSVKRLFADMKEYLGSLADSEKLPPQPNQVSKEDNNLKNLYAISATLHEINPNQEALEKLNKIKLVSMLDLITEGLQAVSRTSTPLAKAPEYQKIVAQNEELAVLLLQLRYNLFAGKALTTIADVGGLFAKLGKTMFTWQPDLGKLSNSAKAEYSIKLMMGAADARARLLSTHHSLANVSGLPTIIDNMDISNVPKGPLAEVLAALKGKPEPKN